MTWDEIDGNVSAFNRLKSLLNTRQAISFVGAGASAGLYPLWDKLIINLVDETRKRGLAPGEYAAWLFHRNNYPDLVVQDIKVKSWRGHLQ